MAYWSSHFQSSIAPITMSVLVVLSCAFLAFDSCSGSLFEHLDYRFRYFEYISEQYILTWTRQTFRNMPSVGDSKGFNIFIIVEMFDNLVSVAPFSYSVWNILEALFPAFPTSTSRRSWLKS